MEERGEEGVAGGNQDDASAAVGWLRMGDSSSVQQRTVLEAQPAEGTYAGNPAAASHCAHQGDEPGVALRDQEQVAVEHVPAG